jgi:hypothetical protein
VADVDGAVHAAVADFHAEGKNYSFDKLRTGA